MEQKVVKLEIGKLIAIIIGVAVIAILATMVLQGGYFKGDLTEAEKISLDELGTKDISTSDLSMVVSDKDTYATTDANLVVSEKDALTIFQSELEKGGDVGIMVNDYIMKTGATLNTEDQALLVKRVESDLIANTDPSIIASDFDKDFVAIMGGTELPPVGHETELEVEKLLKGFESGMLKIESDIHILQLESFGKSIPQFKEKLTGLLKGTEYEKNIDSVMSELDLIIKGFNDEIGKGVAFSVAFDKYFGSMTLSDLGIEKTSDDMLKNFNIIKSDVGIFIGKTLESRDFSSDVDNLVLEFNKGLDSVMSTAPSIDAKVLSDFSGGLDKLNSEFKSAVSIPAYQSEVAIPAYQQEVGIFVKDFGFSF